MKLAIIDGINVVPISTDEEMEKWGKLSQEEAIELAPFVFGIILGSKVSIEKGLPPFNGEKK